MMQSPTLQWTYRLFNYFKRTEYHKCASRHQDVTVLSKICSELIFLECKPFSSLPGIYIPSLTGAHWTRLELDLAATDEKAHL